MKNKKKTLKIILSLVVFILAAIGFTITVFYNHGLLNAARNNEDFQSGQIKVACVGDSVTYGMKMKNWNKNAYPFVLREMLGSDYCVENFGFSGRTVSEKGNKPYTSEELYQQSLDFQPDIVILQIGSNDSKATNWNGSEEFSAYYEKLLESYISLESKPKIFICTPPPAFSTKYKIQPEIIQDEIVPAVKEIAEKYDIEIIDLQEIFADKSELFVDGLHLNPEGGKIFAETVYEVVSSISN